MKLHNKLTEEITKFNDLIQSINLSIQKKKAVKGK